MKINKHYGIFAECEGKYYFRVLDQTYKIERFNYNIMKFLTTILRFNKILTKNDDKRIEISEVTFPIYDKVNECTVMLSFESKYEEYKRHSYECINYVSDHSFKNIKLANTGYFECTLPEKYIKENTIEIHANLHFFLFVYNYLSNSDEYEILDVTLTDTNVHWFFKGFLESSMPSERSIKKYIIKENFE